MPPAKKCGCVSHDPETDTNVGNNIVNIQSSKKFKKDVIQYCRDNKYITAHTNFLCNACYSEGLRRWEKYTASKEDPKLSFHEFIDLIKNGSIGEQRLISVADALGCIFNTMLQNSNICISTNCDLDIERYVENINPAVRCFLNSLCSPSVARKEVKVLNAYEHLVSLTNFNFIGNLNFYMNLVAHYLSGSRALVDMRSLYSPSGSYTYLMNFLSSCTRANVNTFIEPGNDCIYFFDNNQILARNWNVQYNSKALVSVITTLVCLLPPNKSDIQKNPQLSPYLWLSKTDLSQYNGSDEVNDSLFRGQRNCFIERIFSLLIDDDSEITPPPTKQRRVTFQENIPIFSKSNPIDHRYDYIKCEISGKTEVFLLDPILVNPCSFESLQTVLDTIISKSKKEWIIVGCDGLPYNLCCRLIDRTFLCPTCKTQFNTEISFINHGKLHPFDDKVNCKKYKNVVVIPGLGHIEINLTKGIFKLLWDIALKRLAIMLGWRSIKALAACQACTDHHKAWQILQIFLYGTAKELIKPYVTKCAMMKEQPSVAGLYEWINNTNVGPNYKFMFKVVFTYMFGLILYRAGVRHGNFDVLYCAWKKISPLYYGLNMTGYMELNFRFDSLMKNAPEEVTSFIRSTMALSQSGDDNGGEGGDFILENINKGVKSWMPPGVPTEDRWVRVCTNFNQMEKVKDTLLNAFGEQSAMKKYPRKLSNEQEVHYWQCVLRDSNYFNNQSTLTSVEMKTAIDQELLHFEEKCSANKIKYYADFPECGKLERVFITCDDRKRHFDIENKSKQQVKEMVESVLQSIKEEGGDEEYEVMSSLWARQKQGSKKVFIEFYKQATQCLEEVSGRETQRTQCDLSGDEDGPAWSASVGSSAEHQKSSPT